MLSIRTLLAVALGGCAAVAQIGTSTITGRVTDSTGAVVPAVNVTLVQAGTNFTSTAVTNSEGIFRVPSLQPGKYKATFEAAGFKKAVVDEIELRIGDTLPVDMVLQVGNVAESIEVQSQSQLLETETSATGTAITGSVLYDMPLYQRYINSTLNLVPGMTSGGYAYGGDLGAYHLAGQRSGAIGVFEDGVNGNDQLGGTGTIKPLQNAVAEVKVLTTVPPAEYGHSAGGVINVVKKSGTNELHGMGSWYGRTRSMQHRLYFDKFRTSQSTPAYPHGYPTLFMQPDGNISGPVYIPKLYNGKNKTFFFFGYQRLHEKKYAQVPDAGTPTPDMRQGLFTYSGANPIYDPATTARSAAGVWSRQPFAGNVIPVSRFDPASRKVIDFDPWVQPNVAGSFSPTGPTSNLLADEFARTFFNDYNVRIDHQVSSAFKIYGSYTFNGQSGYARPINIRFDRPDFDAQQGIYAPFNQQNESIGYTWVAKPTIVNDSRVGYFRRRSDTIVPSFNKNYASILGLAGVSPALMPAFGSGDRNGSDSIYGITGSTPGKLVTDTASFRNDTTWIRGTHAFKFGYEFLKYRLNSANFARPVVYNFSGVTAGLQDNGTLLPRTGNTFAGFLTGYAASGTFTSELTSWLPRDSIHSFYFQDDWKISPTLTANLGVRYSSEAPFHTQFGLMSNFDPQGKDDLTGRTGAIIHPTSGLSKRDTNNFNPRVGLAWHPFSKWVLRSGFGMYTVDLKFPSNRGQYDEYVATAVVQAAPGDPTPAFQISKGPGAIAFNLRNNTTSPFLGTNFGGRSVEWWDPNLRNAYVMNWNTNVQYEFTRDYLVEVSYQGSSGVGLVERWNINTFPVDSAAGNPTLQNQINSAAQNFRPYPQFGDINLRSNFGHSTFHSGTIKFEKRMSRGLYFDTFYTYSKVIDSSDGDNSGGGVAPIQSMRLEKARAGYDRNHRWLAVVSYELPFGRGKRFGGGVSGWKNHIVGGWELNWIQTTESGNPLNFSFANSPYNYYPGFAGSRRPDVVSTPSLRDGWKDIGGNRFVFQETNALIDMNAFAYPGAAAGCPTTIPSTLDAASRQSLIDKCSFRVGNAGRNIVTGVPLYWAQISAQKNMRFKERYMVQLRWDFQNAFKTYNFNPPGTTVDFQNPKSFAKVQSDPRTASLGGQPLMNLTLMFQF